MVAGPPPGGGVRLSEDGPAVSVVIPTFNVEVYLDECLEALDYANDVEGGREVIVADGGSTDRTVEIAEKHGARVLEAPGSGIAEARNRAVEIARAPLILFLDADCRPAREILQAALERLEDHAAAGAFYEPTDEQGWIARTWLAVERKPEGTVDWVPAGTLAVRREAFDEVDGFREDLQASEDVDLCRRLRSRGYQVYHEPAMACEHLGQPDGLGSFFANEVGRARSLVRSVREGGLGTEMVTLLLAVYHLLLPVALALAIWLAPTAIVAVLVAALAPSLAWALREAPRAGWRRLLQLVALIFVYNVARAWSLVRYNQVADLVG